MKAVQAIRGMPDILPTQTVAWQQLMAQWLDIMQSYTYQEIRLPLLEVTELFCRTIGNATDIVAKEMFSFQDRDGVSISLRPEGTAGCVRAGISNGLLYNQIQRLWYQGPMFRYERPQKGRYRQFYQFGVEAFGLPGPNVEVEHILIMHRLLQNLNLLDKVELQVNSLGSAASRAKYRTALVDYLAQHKDNLDEDSKRRLTTNPLRILDSKNPALQEIINAAPSLLDYLDNEATEHFNKFTAMLDNLGVVHTINPKLVRGLDYYNFTVYEWVTTELGAQGTICAGGRYDNLVEQIGGKATPATGFALGVERLLLLQSSVVEDKIDVYLIVADDPVAQVAGFKLAESLRSSLPKLHLLHNCNIASMKAQFKRADKSNAGLAIVLTEQELANKNVTVKFLREQREPQIMTVAELTNFLVGYLDNGN